MTVVHGDEIVYQDRPTRRSADPFAAPGPGAASARQVLLDYVPRRTAHIHPHSEEVYYVIRGHGEIWVDGARHRVQAGTWVRIPARAPHATMAAPGEQMELICFFPHPDLEENIEELDLALDAPGETEDE